MTGMSSPELLVHSFSTRRYLTEVTLPAIERGLAAAGRSRDDFEISYPCFVVSGRDEKAWQEARTGVARQLAFYASTPAYKGVLDLHGWGDLQPELNRLSKQGAWVEMGDLITDEILDEFAVVAEPGKVAGALKERFGGLVDRLTCTFPFLPRAARPAAIQELRGA